MHTISAPESVINITTWSMLQYHYSRPIGPWHLSYTANYGPCYEIILERVASWTSDDTPKTWIGTITFHGETHHGLLQLDEQNGLISVFRDKSLVFRCKVVED